MVEEVCYSAVQSRCTQYVGTEGRIRSAGIMNENPWAMGREMREDVQTSRNRTVGVCEMGEHEERGSGEYELTVGHAQMGSADDDVLYLFLPKQKIGAKLHIYL